jgi:tRNA-dihydrouridine synthase B
MAVSEMVSCNSLLWGSEKTHRRADHRGEDEPRAVQIVGADPAMMAEAARHNVARGAQIIDINMGCPAKKICNVYAGSALLQNERLVADILVAVVAAVDVPVTLKIRTGWDRTNRNAVAVARVAADSGIQALAIHGRTRADAFAGEAEYDTIAAVKAAVAIPVIANGDISTPQKAAAVLRRTGADGLMIGRAAQGNPWIFREIIHFLATGEELAPAPLTEVCATLLEHVANLHGFYGEARGVRVARKHISWYTKGRGLVGGAAFRHAVNQVETAAEQLTMVREFFDAAAAGLPWPSAALAPSCAPQDAPGPRAAALGRIAA